MHTRLAVHQQPQEKAPQMTRRHLPILTDTQREACTRAC